MFTFRASHPSYSSCPFASAFYNLTFPRILTRCQHVFIAIVIFYSTNASTFSLPDSIPTVSANAPQPLPLTANTLPSSSCSSHLKAHSLSPPPPPRQDYDNNLIAPPPFALSPLCTSSFPSSSSFAAASSLSFHLIADFFYGLSVSAAKSRSKKGKKKKKRFNRKQHEGIETREENEKQREKKTQGSGKHHMEKKRRKTFTLVTTETASFKLFGAEGRRLKQTKKKEGKKNLPPFPTGKKGIRKFE